MPWYRDYFTADYWAYADAEYTAERTAAEVAYLADVLTRLAPGRRVLDVGCGVGRHAIGLARLGFQVVGADASPYALDRASRAAADAGVRLQLRQLDLIESADWGLPPVDAAICVQAFGWGTDADQLRLLRTLRRLLPADGLLVLDHSSVLGIARIYQALAEDEIDGTTFRFNRGYDPVASRSRGEVVVSRGDGTRAVLPDDIRLYTPAEIRSLLTRAGYEVLGVDTEFRSGAPVTIAARYVQFVARPNRVVESALAGHQARAVPAGADLRWAPDEAELSARAVAAAWARVAADPAALPDLARRYDLTDPFGGERAAPVLAAHLGWPAGSAPGHDRITAGAGVTGLLHGLCRLADGGAVLVDRTGHPQIAEAAAAIGGQVVVAPITDLADARAAVTCHRPAVTVVDRPAITGRHWSLAMIRELAATTTSVGGVLVVDETCGGYLAPGTSAAPLTDSVPGLIVLRGMSKGYCCGGLRVGFAVTSPGIAATVRAVLPPLAVSALSLDVALDLLAQPDPLEQLRARIGAAKPALLGWLERGGITVVDTDEHVPWVALPGDAANRAALAGCGVTVKEVPVLDAGRGEAGPGARLAAGLLRMSVPLSAERRAVVETALARAADLAAR
ncbi:MAG TPA: aminotransferase class I/II-fold pyridoxal phosphate-dependent enzyme [Streptosporangiaceae bacterium]|nr:aminotransferase class I/II-fold pyridoxal phosphate-dependent enzyme [Streptosporangiaceae bacterium]